MQINGRNLKMIGTIYRKKFKNYPSANPLIQLEAKGALCFVYGWMGCPCDWLKETLPYRVCKDLPNNNGGGSFSDS